MRITSLLTPVLTAGLVLCTTTLPALGQSKENTANQEKTSPKTVLDKVLGRVRFSGMLQGGYSAGFGPSSPVGLTLPNGANGFSIHRIVLKTQANLTDKLELTYTGNFGPAYTNLEYYATYTPIPEFGIVFGQKKVPFLMDNQMSPAAHELISAMSFLSNYMAAGDPSNPLNGPWSGRDLGLEIKGDLFRNLLGYRLGIYNGQGMNMRDRNKAKTFSGSLSLRPVSGLVLQGSFLSGKNVAVGNALFSNDGKRVSAGEEYQMDRFAGGLAYTSKAFGLRSEYMFGRDGNVRSDGVYATAWVRLVKKLDLVGSYAYADFNKGGDNHISINNYVAGIQYWFLPKCRIRLEYNAMVPMGESGANHAINTQLQFAF